MITTRPNHRLQAAAAAILLPVAVVGMLVTGGCQKRLDPAEYGEVVHGVPAVEGSDKPFPLPKLDEKPEEANDAKK